MPIDSKTFQCFIHSQLEISELYSNFTTYSDNLKNSKFKKFYQVFSIISSTCTGIHLNFIKNLKGVQLCRLIVRLLKAIFFRCCNFQNCTAIVQLKVII